METRWGFSVRNLIIFDAIVCVVFGLAIAWWMMRPPKAVGIANRQRAGAVWSTPTGSWSVEWAEEEGKLKYLAMTHDGHNAPPQLIARRGPDASPVLTLTVPDHPNQPLPSSANVFEWTDGKFRQQRLDVSVDHIRRFCNSQRATYTIDSLREYLKGNDLEAQEPIRFGPVTSEHSRWADFRGDRKWCVQWGQEENSVRYLAFVNDKRNEPKPLILRSSSHPAKSTLAVPGRPNEPLPASANVFEWIDGQFHQRRVEVSVDQARRFCEMGRPEYTIDSLVEYLKSNRPQ
jgi:hypothetical protein